MSLVRLHRWVGIAAVSFALASCGAPEKFPYPPQFVTTNDVPPTVLSAPPAPGSAEFVKGTKAVLEAQKGLSTKQIAVAKGEDAVVPEMMVLPVLGKSVTAKNFPMLYTHLKHVMSDTWRISDATKDYWGSPRPWAAEPKVATHVKHLNSPGYPSGHVTANTILAHVLADLFPCKSSALFARADAVGLHRIQSGAHFPFDVEAGKVLGTAVYNKMKASSAYREEHAQARKEILRAASKGKAGASVCGV